MVIIIIIIIIITIIIRYMPYGMPCIAWLVTEWPFSCWISWLRTSIPHQKHHLSIPHLHIPSPIMTRCISTPCRRDSHSILHHPIPLIHAEPLRKIQHNPVNDIPPRSNHYQAPFLNPALQTSFGITTHTVGIALGSAVSGGAVSGSTVSDWAVSITAVSCGVITCAMLGSLWPFHGKCQHSKRQHNHF